MLPFLADIQRDVHAALGPVLLDALGIRDQAARGFALGTASHGIGTARALRESEVAGAISGLAMGLNALATAIILPLIWARVSPRGMAPPPIKREAVSTSPRPRRYPTNRRPPR